MHAPVFGTESFHPYPISKQSVARLDHPSLVWLQTFKQPKPQEARRIEYLQQFDMKMEHRAGRSHANAYGLSRRPWPADHVADMLEETENSPAPVIVRKTTRNDATTSVKEAQSEYKQLPPPWSNDHLKKRATLRQAPECGTAVAESRQETPRTGNGRGGSAHVVSVESA